jgi:multisubunit Na+/H+ antiporter MnhF subunit
MNTYEYFRICYHREIPSRVITNKSEGTNIFMAVIFLLYALQNSYLTNVAYFWKLY